jgi:GAF domain-containing protein
MSGEEAILLVDDDRGVRETLRDFLKAEGYAVAVAETGTEGLRKIHEGTFGLVVLDLVLPDAKGTTVMREAQQRSPAAPPEFIIMTGRATLDSAIEALEGSAAGYILKPVDFRRLGTIVRRVFERRRLLGENARLQRQLAGQLAESQALVEISSTVSSTLDVREALRRICRALAKRLGADTVAAYLHDPRTDQLVPAAAYHVPREHLATLAAAPLPLREQGFHLPVWTERRAVWSDDVARDPRFTHEMFRSFPHQSGLLLPLLIGGEVAGGFYVVWWTARRRFDEGELGTLGQVCEQVGLLLRNANLYEQAQQTRQRLEVLNEVSRQLAAVHDPEEVLTLIVNQAARLVAAEAAGLRLVEGDELVVSARTESAAALMSRPRLRLGESLSGLVVARGEPVVAEDLATDTRYDPAHKHGALQQGFLGFIGVPLRSQGRVIGTLNAFTKGARHFLPDEIALLSALADQAAMAIEKARLLRAAEEGRRLLERLYHATISMQRSPDRGERLQAFVRAARDIVGFDRVNVLLLTPDGAALDLVTAGGDDSARGLRLPVGPGAGAYHQALQTRRAVVVLGDDDLARLPPLDRALLRHPYLRSRRFVIAPLLIGERVIGVVSADNKPSRRPILASSVEPFSTLCQNLAIALEESRLYAETHAREEEARRLYGVARQLATSLDRERVLDLIATQTLELTRCDASGIYVYDPERDGLAFRRGLHLDPELTRGLLLKPGEGVGGRAFKERRPVWTPDWMTDRSLRYARRRARCSRRRPHAPSSRCPS